MNVPNAALADRVAFFADERLSENIDVTPEGYLICRNAVIGRSGFQTYKVSEIADPEGLLESEKRQLSPEDKIDLWRDPKEVFSPATIASFEGKTFTFTHPDQLLDPDNERYHHAGHVQNVRRGEPLDTGDIPLLADIIVTDRGAIDSIKGGERELSCGYTYKLTKSGNRWDQSDILGNHVALVQKGRAGSEARIYDADPQAGAASTTPAAGHPAATFPADHVPAIRVPKGGSSCATCKFVSLDMLHCASADYVKWNNGSPDLLWPADEFCSDWYVPKAGSIEPKKWTDAAARDSWWKEKPMSLIQRILGMGMKEFAKDAKPEELAEAIRDHTLAIDEKKEDTAMHNGNGNGHRKLRRIGVLRDGTPVFDEAGNPGSSAKVPEPAGVGPVSGTDDDDDDHRGKDEGEAGGEERSAMDRRKKMHDLLDDMLNKSETSAASKATEHDANVGALKELMSEYLGEEAGEKQHTDALPPEFLAKQKKAGDAEEEEADDDEEEADDEEEEKKGEDDEEEKKESKDAESGSGIIRPEPTLEETQEPKNPVGDRVVFDARATMTLLKAFRPIVASSKDRRVRAAFDTLFQGLRKAAKRGGTSKDSYARVIRASGKLAEDKVTAHDSKDGAPRRKESEIQRNVRENDEMYALFMEKNRGLSAKVLEKARNKS